ncbi:CstA-like transporter-associated (seleno)protein [Brevibacterium oceani]|uniref:CstA-like transporter-associated (seleno)protein n=1 Tax=Brevibacterium oceani TaxID=358099 RepID=UPI001FE47FAB|nr:YbdD/YjiX family protein [Brevibacterium oceani]
MTMSTAHPLTNIARDPWGSLRRGGAWLHWYLKEIMGENAYLHYLESYERRHGTRDGAMEEKAFWRDLTDEQDRNPKARCC